MQMMIAEACKSYSGQLPVTLTAIYDAVKRGDYPGEVQHVAGRYLVQADDFHHWLRVFRPRPRGRRGSLR